MSAPGPSRQVAYRGAIEVLPQSTRLMLRSTLALPTLASLLSLLVHNALAAGARRIAVTLCLGPDDAADGPTPFIECADDGTGFSEEWLRMYQEHAGSLAHAATVGCLSVETSVNGKRWSLIRRDGKTLYSGNMDSMPTSLRAQSSAGRQADVARDRGSIVRVDDLYSALPVRRTALQRSSSATCAACASMLAMLALSAPRTLMTLSLRRDGKERVLSRFAATKSPMQRLSDVLDLELTERDVSSIDVLLPLTSQASQRDSSSADVPRGTVRVRGLLVLHSVPRGGQAIFWAGVPVFEDSAEGAALHDGVRSVFARSTFARSATGSPVKSPRAGYVLHLDVELENAHDATRQNVPREEGLVLGAVDATLQSVVAEELYKRGLLAAPRRSKRAAAEDLLRPETASQAPRLPTESSAASERTRAKRPRTSLGQRVADLAAAQSEPRQVSAAAPLPSIVDKPPSAPVARPMSRLTKADFSRPRNDDAQSAPPDWLLQSLSALADPVLPQRTEPDIPSLDTAVLDAPLFPEAPSSRASRRAHISASTARANALPLPAAQLASRFFGGSQGEQQPLLAESLQDARVIQQVDRKFIASTIRLESQQALVLLDQHAADERVRFELMLQPLLHGALTSGAASHTLSPARSLALPPRSVASLLEPAHAHSIERWGFSLRASDSAVERIEVHAVPSLLRERLSESDTLSQTLLSLAEWVQAGGAGALEAAARVYVRDEAGEDAHGRRWMRGMRHLPSRLAELVASKACRGAVMFNDALEKEQCQRLLAQLAGTALPFQCAHGRPTMIPLCHLRSPSSRRPVDWTRLPK